MYIGTYGCVSNFNGLMLCPTSSVTTLLRVFALPLHHKIAAVEIKSKSLLRLPDMPRAPPM